jgi:hypothetical protein
MVPHAGADSLAELGSREGLQEALPFRNGGRRAVTPLPFK